MEEIVISAGKYAVSQWHSVVAIQKGDEGDVVTEVDRTIEGQIKGQLYSLAEGAGFVGEESGGTPGNLYWVVDPIDGTKHYAHQMPGFFTQVALMQDNEPLVSVVYDPTANHLFSASRGNGATFNGQRIIATNRASELSKAVIDIDFGGAEDNEWKSKVFAELVRQTYRVRISGGRFSPYLLTGGVNAVLVVNPTTKIWDQMPRVLLMQEAGFGVKSQEREGHTVRVMAESALSEKIWEIVNSIQ